MSRLAISKERLEISVHLRGGSWGKKLHSTHVSCYTSISSCRPAGVHLRVKLLSEAAVERAGSSLRDPCCFKLEGLENEEHDAIPIHTVLAKVSFSEGDGGEPTRRYYTVLHLPGP